MNQGTFRVVTENIPCGTTGTTCSKSIKVFLGVSCLVCCFVFFYKLCQKDRTSCPRLDCTGEVASKRMKMSLDFLLSALEIKGGKCTEKFLNVRLLNRILLMRVFQEVTVNI